MWKIITACIWGFLFVQCTDGKWDLPDNEPVHDDAWMNTQLAETTDFHGNAAKTHGTQVCTSCHGEDLQGEPGVVSGCFFCHFGPDGSLTPDETKWRHGRIRHWEFEAERAVCNRCHGIERSYDTPPQACHDCHGEGIGHVLGQAWLDKKSGDFHGPVPKDNCTDCHDLNQQCTTCHFTETGSKSPPGSGWVHDGDSEDEDHRLFERFEPTCNRCHGLNRSYNNGPASCHDCHEEEDDESD